MRETSSKRILARLTLVLLALPQLTCNQALLGASIGSTITVIPNPTRIKANGGESTITAIVIEGGTGTPVADGTVVQFFTNLGRIQEQARTNDGVARVQLVSDSRSGQAALTVISGAVVNDDATVDIGGVLPERIFLRAVPTRLTDRRAATIIATVLDDAGNPIPDIGVTFRIKSVVLVTTPPPPSPAPPPTPPTLPEEFMESRGSPVFTDNNGEAKDVMRTERPFDDVNRYRVTVNATVLTGPGSTIDADVEVLVN